MQNQMNSFIEYCETMTIAKEQETKISLSTKAIASLKKLIITCRHAIQRFLLNLKQNKKISIPREIEQYSNNLTNECMGILGKLQFGKLTKDEFNDTLKSLKSDTAYQTLFHKKGKIYNNNSYVDIDTGKVIQTLKTIDKDLELYEKELINVSSLQKKTVYDIDTMSCCIIILSEAMKIQSAQLKWKKTKASDEVVDLDINIKAEYDKPSF